MERRGKIESVLAKLYPLFGILLLVAVWAIAAAILQIEIILPAPSAAVRRFFQLLGEASFWVAVGGTVWRTLLSFIVSFVLAVGLALLARFVRPAAKILQPIVTVLRAMPTMSVILLALIWMTSRTAPILIASLVAFPMLYSSFYSALSELDGDLLEMSKVYRVPRKDVMTKFCLPYLAPSLFSASGSSLGLTLKLMVAAEALAQTNASIGSMMQMSKLFLDTAELMAWTIAAVAIGYLLELAVGGIRKLTVRWKG